MNTNKNLPGVPGTVISPLSNASTLRRQQGRATPWILGVVVLALAAGGWWWWKGRGAEGAAGGPASAASGPAGAGGPGGPGAGGAGRGGRFAANRVQPVSVMPARLQDIRHTAAAIGTISASNTAVVRAQVSGVLQQIH